MEANPLSTLEEVDTATVNELADEHDVGELLDDELPDDTMLAVQQMLFEALAFIGPHRMDDEGKWQTIQSILAGMVLADIETDQDGSSTLPTDAQEVSVGRLHHNPLDEIDELDEPTVKALGKQYNVGDIIDYTPGDNFIIAIQTQLAGALLDLSMTRFRTKYDTGKAILAAMVLVDRYHDGYTELELNDIVNSYTRSASENEDGDVVEVEYDSKEVQTTVVHP